MFTLKFVNKLIICSREWFISNVSLIKFPLIILFYQYLIALPSFPAGVSAVVEPV